ncbi:hypothetical protein TWF106_004616 [Orbilia oligospora]|uniref:DNA replication factor Cdt1 C-terminal domain-containing protein n=1 Tax=Orbilia oligospora TaxID=2813651 RepID=A0A7C8Q5N9_ORBOL|nr:hypothetical protein TWF106_004616 [Orbilia oligospora]KAF3212776.1 hypothetical protein TWF679_005663 [Orbilia oligospora]
MGRPKKSSTATAAKKGAKTSKSTATVKGQTTLKTQTTLKNSLTKSTTSTATSGIKFKASKVTRASEKKKGKEVEEEEVVKVEVEKKKEAVEEVASTTTVTNATATTTATTTAVESKETKEEKVPVTPRKTRNKRTIEDILEDPVSKRVKLDDTADEPAQTPTPSKRRTTSSVPATASSKVSKPIEQEEKGDDEEEEEEDNALPKRILRLITIHNSIISLLLLDYATQPAILAEYLPQISRNANTNITLVDLQRIVTLSEGTIRLLVVENRGNAIELVNGVNWKTSNLGQKFKTRIEKWWEGKTKAERKDEDKLLGSIELAEILPENTTSSTSSSQATTGLQTPPVTPSKPKGVATTPLSKGQRRLQDLKNFTLSKQTSLSPSPIKKKENISLSTGNSPSVANRKSSLLERIRAKAQAASSTPAPPPPAVLQRRAAMQWLESIIPILLQLTTPASTLGTKSKLHVPSTTSFPMTTVIENVKTSLQKPVASEDIERSLRLLADEVATDFVKIVEWKGDSTGSPLVGVVFNRNGRAKVEGWKYIEEEEKA